MNITNLYFVPVQRNKVYIICINPLHSHATKKICTNLLTSIQGSYPDPVYVYSLYSVQVYYTPRAITKLDELMLISQNFCFNKLCEERTAVAQTSCDIQLSVCLRNYSRKLLVNSFLCLWSLLTLLHVAGLGLLGPETGVKPLVRERNHE